MNRHPRRIIQAQSESWVDRPLTLRAKVIAISIVTIALLVIIFYNPHA